MCPDHSKSRPICTECKQRPVMLAGKRKSGSIRYKPTCGSCDWKKRRERQESRFKAQQEARDAKVMEEVQSGMDALLEKHQDEVASLKVRLAESEQDLAGVRADLGRRLEESEVAVARQESITADLKRKLKDAASVAASSIEKANQSSRRAIRESNRVRELEHTVKLKLEELAQLRSRMDSRVGVLTKERDALQSEVEQRRTRELDLTSSLEGEKRRLAELNADLLKTRQDAAQAAQKAQDLLDSRDTQLQDKRSRLKNTDRRLSEAMMGFAKFYKVKGAELEELVAMKQALKLELAFVQERRRRTLWVGVALFVCSNMIWLAAWSLA
jgi:chromosome segregation ATPase